MAFASSAFGMTCCFEDEPGFWSPVDRNEDALHARLGARFVPSADGAMARHVARITISSRRCAIACEHVVVCATAQDMRRALTRARLRIERVGGQRSGGCSFSEGECRRGGRAAIPFGPFPWHRAPRASSRRGSSCPRRPPSGSRPRCLPAARRAPCCIRPCRADRHGPRASTIDLSEGPSLHIRQFAKGPRCRPDRACCDRNRTSERSPHR